MSSVRTTIKKLVQGLKLAEELRDSSLAHRLIRLIEKELFSYLKQDDTGTAIHDIYKASVDGLYKYKVDSTFKDVYVAMPLIEGKKIVEISIVMFDFDEIFTFRVSSEVEDIVNDKVLNTVENKDRYPALLFLEDKNSYYLPCFGGEELFGRVVVCYYSKDDQTRHRVTNVQTNFVDNPLNGLTELSIKLQMRKLS